MIKQHTNLDKQISALKDELETRDKTVSKLKNYGMDLQGQIEVLERQIVESFRQPSRKPAGSLQSSHLILGGG